MAQARSPVRPEETMQAAMARYEGEGFTGQFGARPGGRVMCFSCRRESDAGKVRLFALHRFEGQSDPGDQGAVAAVVCPSCKAKGTLGLSYGAGAAPEDAAVLSNFADRRTEGGLRPGV